MELIDASDVQPEQITPPEPPAPKPTFLTKPIKILIGITVGILVIIGSAVGYRMLVKKPENSVKPFVPFEEQKNKNMIDWKIYSNVKLGISFNYPSNYKILDENDRSVDMISPNPSVDILSDDLRVIIEKIPAVKGQTLDQYINSMSDRDTKINYRSKTIIGGFSAEEVKFQSLHTGGEGEDFFIPMEDYYYEISKQPLKTTRQSEFDEIISSFKFLDQEDTTSWKTYTNAKIGYSLKYPSAVTVEDPNDPTSESYIRFLVDKDQLLIKHLDNPQKQNAKDFYNNLMTKSISEAKKNGWPAPPAPLETQEASIANIPVFQVTGSAGDGNTLHTYIAKDTSVIDISFYKEDSKNSNINNIHAKLFNQILLSFQFVSQDSLRFDNFSFMVPKDWTGVISDAYTVNLRNQANEEIFIEINERENTFPEAKTAKQLNEFEKKDSEKSQSEECKKLKERGVNFCVPRVPGFTEDFIAEADELFEKDISAVEVHAFAFSKGNGVLKKYIVLKKSKAYEILFEFPENTNMLSILKGIHIY